MQHGALLTSNCIFQLYFFLLPLFMGLTGRFLQPTSKLVNILHCVITVQGSPQPKPTKLETEDLNTAVSKQYFLAALQR